MVKIALSMIVKNESKIIQRCLDSVVDIVDFILIQDTGSTDDTVERIEQWAISNNCETVVKKEDFVNFAYNRTLSLQSVITTFVECDYILLLDADMQLCLSRSSRFQKNDLTADCYLVEQKNANLTYSNLRLVRADSHWRYIGKTHEVLISDRNISPAEKLSPDEIYILDIGDGGSKEDKFVRDEKLLLSGLQEIAANGDKDDLKTRYQFYLGQTYYSLCNYTKALQYYQICAENKQAWLEQNFYCHLMSAECCNMIGEEQDRVLHFSFQALKASPLRAEPYFRILRYFNDNKMFMISHTFATIALQQVKIQLNSEDHFLFEDMLVLNYQIPIEAAVADYYQGKKEYKNLMTSLIKKMEQDYFVPDAVRASIIANAKYM